MVKLKKEIDRGWNGNGMGYDDAQWVVAKDPSIKIMKIGYFWRAMQDGKTLVKTWYKKDLLAMLAEMRPELAR